MKKCFLSLTLLILISGTSLFAQLQEENPVHGDTASYPYWIEMMKDPNSNYYETVKAFNIYWTGRTITKGCGWKPFKRWEYYWRTRLNPDGTRLKPGVMVQEVEKLKAAKGKSAFGDWQLLGPINRPTGSGIGRLNAIGFHPTNSDIIYVGAPSGGLWRTINAGQTWQSLTEDLPTLGVSAIAVHPNDPNTIFIGTGDDDADDALGYGVFKSIDGGQTWQESNTGIENVIVSKILIVKNNPQIMLAATLLGVYKSTDGGQTWVYKQGGKFTDILFRPYDENTVYGTAGGYFYKSTNAGDSWRRITAGITGSSRAVCAVTNANPDKVYVLTTNNETFKALYSSENQGESFTQKSTSPNIMGYQASGSDTGGQAWYDLCMTADPVNPNLIFAGGINIFKSSNGGASWSCAGHWTGSGAPYVHADQHVMAFSPLNGKLYVGNDGGFYVTANSGTSWTDLSDGLAITQVYKIGQSATIKNLILSGYQDNGTALYNNGTWAEVIGGDGMECQIDYSDPNYRFGELYYGQIRRATNGSPSFSTIAGNGVNGINEEGDWVTPFMLHKTVPTTMFAGYKSLWRCTTIRNISLSWTKISASVTNPSASNILCLDQSVVNPSVFYFSRADGKMFRSDNVTAATPAWVALNSAPSGVITDIETHPSDENIVFISNANQRIFKSENKGSSWTKISDGLPSVPINCLAFDKRSNEGLYVGTDVGVFYKDNNLPNWVYFSDGLPMGTRVTEIEFYYHPTNRDEDRIRIATYGRGIWEAEFYSNPIAHATDAEIVSMILPNIFAYEEGVPQVKVKNMGTNTITSLSLQYKIDGGLAVSMEWTGSIASKQVATINLPAFTTGNGTHLIEMEILQANAIADQNTTNNKLAGSFSVSYANQVTLQLLTDNLGSETTWELKNSNNQVITSGGPYTDGSQENVQVSFALSEACYTFYLYDAGNNGICCSNGNGQYTLTNTSTGVTIGTGGSFAGEVSHNFCIESGSVPVVDFTASQTLECAGTAVTFTAQTTGTVTAYQWYFGQGASPETATGIGPHQVSYSGDGYKSVSLKVSGSLGDFTANKPNYIGIKDVPIIGIHPQGQTLCADDKLRLYVSSNGIGQSFQWKKDGVVIAGATSPIFEILNTLASDAGSYTCEISNSCESVASNPALVVIKPLPNLMVSVSPASVCSGQATQLTASGATSYLWSNSLGTNASVSVSPAVTTSYFVEGTTNGCTIRKDASVAVAAMPTITTHPVDVQICEGNNASFFVAANGKYLWFQWLKNGVEIEGATDQMLVLSGVTPEMDGAYSCRVSTACGDVTSNAANLSLSPNPVANYTFVSNDKTVVFTNQSVYSDSYLWNFGDGSTTTLVSPTHTYNASGQFEVKLIATNDCSTDTLVQNISISSIPQVLTPKEFGILPNPNQGNFTVYYEPEKISDLKLQIFNLQGKVVFEDTQNKQLKYSKDINILIPGIYHIRLVTGDKIFKEQVLVY